MIFRDAVVGGPEPVVKEPTQQQRLTGTDLEDGRMAPLVLVLDDVYQGVGLQRAAALCGLLVHDHHDVIVICNPGRQNEPSSEQQRQDSGSGELIGLTSCHVTNR